MKIDIDRIIKDYNILLKKNVIGYSRELQEKLRNGVPTGEKAIRIYVSKKEPDVVLDIQNIIPKCVKTNGDEVQTDVVEIGELKALGRTDVVRPVLLGVSVGSADITAGSLGMLYKDKQGNLYAGTNAHVVTAHPNFYPEAITEKRIVQPGMYHQPNVNNQVGEYYWHKMIVPLGLENNPSPCNVGGSVAKLLNVFPKILGREGRFSYVDFAEPNHIDFGIYVPTVEHLPIVDNEYVNKNNPFIGHLFAGSAITGIICKAKYIEREGYYPVIPSVEVKVGDAVAGCSFWGDYTTDVIDTAGVVTVNYGDFVAKFEDVIIVENADVIRGGWSGSGWRKV